MSDEELKSRVKAGDELRVGDVVIPKKRVDVGMFESPYFTYTTQMEKYAGRKHRVKFIDKRKSHTTYVLDNDFSYIESWLTRA